MISRKGSVLRGVCDGLGSGLLMILWSEFARSPWSGEQYQGCLAAWVIALVLSLALFFLLVRTAKTHLLGYYVCGRIALAVSLLLSFINKMSFHIELFPARDLSDAEGFLVVPMCVAYILITEFLRLAVCLAFAFKKKTDSGMNNNS